VSTLRRASGTDLAGMTWVVNVSGEPVPLVAYPYRQTKQGVSVEVNRGKRTLLKGAFIATMQEPSNRSSVKYHAASRVGGWV
jgi:hypothetical protein